MKVKDVFIEYSKIVSFPWSARKIKKAGKNPVKFLLDFAVDLQKCNDFDAPASKELLELFTELKLLSST